MNEELKSDPEIYQAIQNEIIKSNTKLNMIPSENFCTKSVLAACGSVLNNKYSEGYPGKRYYQGNENCDITEIAAIERAKKLFGAEHANVQPDSGSIANNAVYFALLKPKEKIMGLRLDMGGHLTHGHKVSASARFYSIVQYGVDKETGLIDMDKVRKMAEQEKPKVIVSGATAYPRLFDFKEFHDIAQSVGAYSIADISHIAGLIVGDAHPSPFPFTDVVTTTTHKTLRGPRSALILCKKENRLANVEGLNEKQAAKEKSLAGKIDRAVFPGMQGGPHEHIIAAKAVAFAEAMKPEFQNYAKQIVKNAKVLSEKLMSEGIKLVSNGTDNHLMLIDLINTKSVGKIGLGKEGAVALEEAGIVTNCNTIPYDPSTPFKPSGIRIGTPILTTMGMKEQEMEIVGNYIAKVINNLSNSSIRPQIKEDVKELCSNFKFY
jgi:glycine hydroxymethyltransferase